MWGGGREFKGPGQHARELMTVTLDPQQESNEQQRDKRRTKENAKNPACVIPSRRQDEVER